MFLENLGRMSTCKTLFYLWIIFKISRKVIGHPRYLIGGFKAEIEHNSTFSEINPFLKLSLFLGYNIFTHKYFRLVVLHTEYYFQASSNYFRPVVLHIIFSSTHKYLFEKNRALYYYGISSSTLYYYNRSSITYYY